MATCANCLQFGKSDESERRTEEYDTLVSQNICTNATPPLAYCISCLSLLVLKQVLTFAFIYFEDAFSQIAARQENYTNSSVPLLSCC